MFISKIDLLDAINDAQESLIKLQKNVADLEGDDQIKYINYIAVLNRTNDLQRILCESFGVSQAGKFNSN